jgi:hypothetical protein
MKPAFIAGRYAATVTQHTITPSQIERTRSRLAAAVDSPVTGLSREEGDRGLGMGHPHLCRNPGRLASKTGWVGSPPLNLDWAHGRPLGCCPWSCAFAFFDRMPIPLTPRLASKFTGLALAGIGREWPHAYQLLARGRKDLRSPRELHPAFFGCLDWHSAVHGHWTLARILRLFPHLPVSARIRVALNQSLTEENIFGELAYFRSPGRGSFERPYGWGWLLALAAELRAGRDADFRWWSAAIRSLEDFIAEGFCAYLPRLPYPMRTGVHSNTAFGLTLALDYARATSHRRLEATIVSRSRAFYGSDVDAPVVWEPGGADFLSPSLTEADLMSRVLSAAAFRRWLGKFLPGLAAGGLRTLMQPPKVHDRRDPMQVHLDGLCLSRAWALQRIGSVAPVTGKFRLGAERNARAGLRRVSSGDYAGEHWLASFAVYLLTDLTES